MMRGFSNPVTQNTYERTRHRWIPYGRQWAAVILLGTMLAGQPLAATLWKSKSEKNSEAQEANRRRINKYERPRESRKRQEQSKERWNQNKESEREKKLAATPISLQQKVWFLKTARVQVAQAQRTLQKAGALRETGGPEGVRERPADFRVAYQNARQLFREAAWFRAGRRGYRSQLDYENYRKKYDYLLKQKKVAERYIDWATTPLSREDQNWVRKTAFPRLRSVEAELAKLQESPIPPPADPFGNAQATVSRLLLTMKRMLRASRRTYKARDLVPLKEDLKKVESVSVQVPKFLRIANEQHELDQTKERVEEIKVEIGEIKGAMERHPWKAMQYRMQLSDLQKELARLLDKLK